MKRHKKNMVEETHICNIEFLFWHIGYFGMVEEKYGGESNCSIAILKLLLHMDLFTPGRNMYPEQDSTMNKIG